MTCCELMVRVPKADAQRIYLYCFHEKKTVRKTRFESLAAQLNTCFSTERGNEFTAVVVRNNLAILRDLKLVKFVELGKGFFNFVAVDTVSDALYLNSIFSAKPSQKADAFGYDNDAANDNDIDNDVDNDTDNANDIANDNANDVDNDTRQNCVDDSENADSAPVSDACENAEKTRRNSAENDESSRARAFKQININSFNKQTKESDEQVKQEETSVAPITAMPNAQPTQAVPNAQQPRVQQQLDERPTIDDALANVDLNSEELLALRRELVVKMYEPDLHVGLVDRVVGAIALGYVERSEMLRLIFNAKDSIERGLSKEQKLWRIIGRTIIKKFSDHGYRWTGTTEKLEPKPAELAQRQLSLAEREAQLERNAERDALRKHQAAQKSLQQKELFRLRWQERENNAA